MWSSIKIKQLNKTKQDISLKMLQIEYWIMIIFDSFSWSHDDFALFVILSLFTSGYSYANRK